MGRNSRLREERRNDRAADAEAQRRQAWAHRQAAWSQPGASPERDSKATKILKELHSNIQRVSSESGRRCWEAMLEIMAWGAGINTLGGGTLTSFSGQMLKDLGPERVEHRLVEYMKEWNEELRLCQSNGSAIPDPIGDVLNEAEGTNDALGQFLTPMSVVRMTNKLTFDHEPEDPLKRHTKRGLDPCCGTGRFAMDALVHYRSVIMYNVDVDLWMTRAALVNFRYMAEFSLARIERPMTAMGGFFDKKSARDLEDRGVASPTPEDKEGTLLILGGRSWILHADSLIVDLEEPLNWRFSWTWNPPNWRDTLKVNGWAGTYAEWEKARPKDAERHQAARLNAPTRAPRFDFALDDAELLTKAATGGARSR